MIPNVSKGGDMRGLVYYLVSTDATRRSNENAHEDPHVVGGDAYLQSWYGSETLNAAQAAEIADYLDLPRQTFGTEVWAATYEQDAEGNRRRVGERNQTVWHCSLSLADGETLSGEQWAQVTREFADGMGFTDAGGHAPARWVAIHHGAGKGGHDHVHIAASMVREDGTRWEGRFRDFPAAQRVCRELEERHGLVAVEGREHGTAMQGPTPAAHRRGDRDELAHRVRAAAVASTSEAEWLHRLHADGVTIKPRFAAGSTDVVVGYRASLGKDAAGEWNFYSGGSLGRDLTLPRVRECWPAPSLDQAQAASDEWQRAYRGRQPAGGTPAQAPNARDAITALQGYERRLRSVPPGDRRAWSHAARDVSGALSAWARVDPGHGTHLRHAAQVIARTAQDRRPGLSPRPMMTLAPALAFLAAEKPNNVTKGALAAALIDLAGAFATWHRASRRLAEAQRLTVVGAQLKDTGERMRTGQPSAEAQLAKVQRLRSAWGTPTRGPASPLPNVLPPMPARNPYVHRGNDQERGR